MSDPPIPPRVRPPPTIDDEITQRPPRDYVPLEPRLPENVRVADVKVLMGAEIELPMEADGSVDRYVDLIFLSSDGREIVLRTRVQHIYFLDSEAARGNVVRVT